MYLMFCQRNKISKCSFHTACKVFLFDGKKFTLNLNSYDGTGRKLSDECRSSRSTFLDWLKEEKIVNEDVFLEFNNLSTKEQEEKSEEIVSVADKSNEDNCSKETVEEKQKEIENFIHQEEIDETVDNNLDDELEGDGNKEEGEDNEIEGNNSKVEGDDDKGEGEDRGEDNGIDGNNSKIEGDDDKGEGDDDKGEGEDRGEDNEIDGNNSKIEGDDDKGEGDDDKGEGEDREDNGIDGNNSKTEVDDDKAEGEDNVSVEKEDDKVEGDEDKAAVEENNLPISLDTLSIKQHLAGKNVLVHISNLIEPKQERKVRELDLQHVKKLEAELLKSGNMFTVLVGYVQVRPKNLSDLKLPGRGKIEVIGGNHTRQALINLEKNVMVTMDIYYNLTNMQALKLGFIHNEMHNSSKSTSFEDLCKLFREVLKAVEKEKTDVSQKMIILEWRSRIAEIMSKERSKIKNHFQTHLHCASLPENVWRSLECVFESWRKGRITKQPNKEAKQTHFTHLFRIHDSDEKMEILMDLADGNITFKEFRDKCLKQQSKRVVSQEEGAVQNMKKTKQSKKTTICTVSSELVKEKDQEIQSLRNQLSVAKKNNEQLEKDRQQEKDRILETNQNLKENVDSMKKEIDQLQTENAELKKEAEKPRQCEHVEIIKEMEKKIKKFKEELSQKEELIQNLKEQVNTADAANRARKEIKESTKKRPANCPINGDENQPMQKRVRVNIQKGNEQPITDGESGMCISGIKNQEKSKLAVVKYNEKFYLGLLLEKDDDKEFVYCKSPICKLTKGFIKMMEDNNSRKLNFKDKQSVDNSSIIHKFCRKIVNNSIEIDEAIKTAINEKIKKHSG